MKTVILCGGLGTRIRDVSDNLPKPMIPISGYPILWHIMKFYASFNYNNFILCLGYKSETIKDYFLNYEKTISNISIDFSKKIDNVKYELPIEPIDWKITLVETGLNSMTGSRISKIKNYIGSDPYFFLTYGDGLCDVDVDDLLKFHKSHGRILTLTGVRPPARFGELNSTIEGIVTEFNEKPQALSGRISGGFFVCSNDIFNYLNDTNELVFEDAPIKNLVKENQLMVYEHNGFWQCMDTYRDWQLLNNLSENSKAPWKK